MKLLRLSELRRQAGLTQVGLAQKMQLHPSTLAQWESGRKFPRWQLIPSLATALGCGIRDLFADKPEVA